ncbi:Wzz/FepE/Etk N-terminal domain-containing protein [Devosia neptuniae]|uniref:Wzz/FepE/Etk N-terminal domain-containing protein n=1 Tax=Devosia neptuniae TaxID=191302 RepID=A0ABY6CBZ9_9HYPH|nr:Wzz/FepE/Etk N-terminal domain-containing protein [Devosia neptuniae]UXN69750.1 Wzz/FepE/Etk N-terminal domain-containing protein [Devosia neptuniae]
MTYESPAVRDARIDVGAVLGAVFKRLPRIILITLLLLAAAFAFLMFQPRLYESSASILIEPRDNVYTRASNDAVAPNPTDASVVSSQMELLKSRDTLLKVVDQLDLRSVPEFNGSAGGGFSPMAVITQMLGRKSAPVSVDEIVLSTLYDRMTVIQARDSRIMSVLVRSTNPQLAADIANAVANAHVTRRAQLSLSDTAEASTWLREEIDKLRVRVTDAERAVADFKVNNDLFTGGNNTSLVDQQLSTIASQISAAQERKNTALSRAAVIRGLLDRGQPIDSLNDVRQSPAIQQLSEEKARLQGEKAQRSATLLDNHPTIRALTAQIAELNNQIAIEGRRVAEALEAEAQVEADVETSLQADLTRVKSSASTATQDTVTLDGLEREAKAQRDLLEGYLQRYNEAISRTDSNSALPDVRVISVAAPSVSPASPRTAMVLLAVGIVSVALQVGIIIFSELISGRAIVPGVRPQDELEAVPFSEDELEPDQRWEEPTVAEAVPVKDEPAPERIEPVVAVQDEPVAPAKPVEEPVQAIMAEPEITAEAKAPAEPVRANLPPANTISYSQLASDLVLGRTHLVILAGQSSNEDCEDLAEELVGDALAKGLSVALVDAGSGRASDEAGLTDLSTESVSFGDVVHKSADNSFAEIPWGQGTAIDRRSSKPITLIEALGDIYEVVVIMTGPVGMASTLSMFGALDGRILLVAPKDEPFEAIEQTRIQLAEAGFGSIEIAAVPERVAA